MALIDVVKKKSVNFPRGKATVSAKKLPIGVSKIRIALSREGWPDTGQEIAQLRCEVSMDNGLTWPFHAAIGVMGGDFINRDGSIASESFLAIDLPEKDNPNRMLRGTINIEVPMKTAINIQVE